MSFEARKPKTEMSSLWRFCAPLVLAFSIANTGYAQSRTEKVERAKTLFRDAQVDYEAGRIHDAVKKMQEAHKLAPSRELAFNLGRMYERLGDARNGVRFFRLYLEGRDIAAPERADIERRIQVLRGLEQRQRDQIFRAPPSTDELTAESRSFFERGVAMFRRRQYAAAMQAFVAAQSFAPFPELLYNMAVTAERLSEPRDAIDYYREYLRLRRDAPDRIMVEEKIRTLRGK